MTTYYSASTLLKCPYKKETIFEILKYGQEKLGFIYLDYQLEPLNFGREPILSVDETAEIIWRHAFKQSFEERGPCIETIYQDLRFQLSLYPKNKLIDLGFCSAGLSEWVKLPIGTDVHRFARLLLALSSCFTLIEFHVQQDESYPFEMYSSSFFVSAIIQYKIPDFLYSIFLNIQIQQWKIYELNSKNELNYQQLKENLHHNEIFSFNLDTNLTSAIVTITLNKFKIDIIPYKSDLTVNLVYYVEIMLKLTERLCLYSLYSKLNKDT